METSEFLHGIVFYLMAALVFGGGVIVARSRNLVYSAFSLLFAFLGVAGLYILAYADFVAIVQVVVYVGGILVLFLFGMMLTRDMGVAKISNELSGTVMSHVIPIVITGVLIAVVMIGDWNQAFSTNKNGKWMGPSAEKIWKEHERNYRENPALKGAGELQNIEGEKKQEEASNEESKTEEQGEDNGTIGVIGDAFMGKYLLVFEEIALLLLVALLGACYLARRPSEEEIQKAKSILEEERS